MSDSEYAAHGQAEPSGSSRSSSRAFEKGRRRAAITALSAYAPPEIVTNADLEKIVDTNDEWIRERTGIIERRIMRQPGSGTSDLALPAIKELLKKRGIEAEELDLIICATTSPDHVFPATANILAHKLGLTRTPGWDVAAACSGFMYTLSIGAQFIESGMYSKVLVVGADKMSSMTNYTDRSTCIIFGDGGGAVLLEPDTEGYGLLDSALYADGSGFSHLHQIAGGSVNPSSHWSVDHHQHSVLQDGKHVFKHAVTKMAEAAAEIMERNGLVGDDIAWLCPHQANLRIIDATARRMNVPLERTMINIQKYGNTTNGTIPLALNEYEPRLKKGDLVVFAAFGGGFTWGSHLVRWAYDGAEAGLRSTNGGGELASPVPFKVPEVFTPEAGIGPLRIFDEAVERRPENPGDPDRPFAA